MDIPTLITGIVIGCSVTLTVVITYQTIRTATTRAKDFEKAKADHEEWKKSMRKMVDDIRKDTRNKKE